MRAPIVVVFLAVAAIAAAQPQYTVVDLTKQFGPDFSARTINNHGVIAGSMFIDFQTTQACIVENGKLTMLPMYQGKHDWYALDMNDNGDVLGGMELGGETRTVLYRNGKVIDIGVQGEQFSAAGRGLNNLGQVVGTIPVGIPQAFVWENGSSTLLPGLSSGANIANALSDSGVVAGASESGGVGSDDHAAKWVSGGVVDIHPAWAATSMAVAVNSSGYLAGWARAPSFGQQGVVWQGGKIIQLPNFGGGQSRAYDINDSGQVVGWATNTIGHLDAFLWDNGSFYNVSDLLPLGHGYDLAWGTAIVNDGRILMLSSIGSTTHWLVLNPVPEPQPAVVLGGVLISTVLLRKKQQQRRQ